MRHRRPLLVLNCGLLLSALPAGAESPQTVATDSSFTVQRNGDAKPGCADSPPPNDQSIDVAVVTFNDDGTFARPGQLDVALDCITHARQKNPNGAVVLLFVHGWHHNAAWADEHFVDFRKILMSLALREAERYVGAGTLAGRRVVGICIGWSGDPQRGLSGLIAKYVSTYPLIFNRYKVAEHIAAGGDIRQTLNRVIERTKSASGPDSPLALVGHSMGGMILETALEALLREDRGVGAPRAAAGSSCVRVERDGRAATFPDLVLLLNSAADAAMSTSLMQLLEQRGIRKVVACGTTPFEAPLIISATSEGDTATRDWFRRAKPGHATAANTPTLLTHRFTPAAVAARCSPLPINHLADDYQQSWHCLRAPALANGTVTQIAIDLPQVSSPRNECHVRFQLTRLSTSRATAPYWLFQLPTVIVRDHNDIFNGRSNLLIMSLMQLSGSIMSLADKWSDVFEPEEGPCAAIG